MKDGTYFVGAFAGKRREDGRPFGLVELVVVESGKGQTQKVFCDHEVASRARDNFELMAPVAPQFETVMQGRGPRARLVEVTPA